MYIHVYIYIHDIYAYTCVCVCVSLSLSLSLLSLSLYLYIALLRNICVCNYTYWPTNMIDMGLSEIKFGELYFRQNHMLI